MSIIIMTPGPVPVPYQSVQLIDDLLMGICAKFQYFMGR